MALRVEEEKKENGKEMTKQQQREARRRSVQRLATVAHIKQSNTVKGLVRQVGELSSAMSRMRRAVSNIDQNMGSAPVSRETLPKILNTALDIRFQQEEKKRKRAMESGIADIDDSRHYPAI